ncbi:hypothetical protein [Phytoactinopolyspora limicola]|uniref:hypothetical protein n=1 Tax=Phytoactinopolyspora limicola TaxID=2715536 RepID=UPI00140BD3B6|nr:hypothetical protein [Phytoactinopolyspora limicola]
MTATIHDRPEPPRRRLRLRLRLEADTLDEIERALTNIGIDLLSQGIETREVISGGYASGYDLSLGCDPDMDGDRYRAELDAWRDIHRA